MSLLAVLAAKAARADVGWTWMPSRMRPAHALRSAKAAPTGPGLRPSSGGMALKRCVKPVAPAASAASTVFARGGGVAEADGDAGGGERFQAGDVDLFGRDGDEQRERTLLR